jgi:hypothetical protein
VTAATEAPGADGAGTSAHICGPDDPTLDRVAVVDGA